MNVRVPISNSATRFKAALFYSSPVGNAILVVLHAPAALAAQVHPGHVVNLRSRGFIGLPPCRTRESFRGLAIFHAPAALAAQVHPGHVVNLHSRGFIGLPPCRTRESFRGLVILHAPAALAAQVHPGHIVNLRSREFTCLPPCRTRESFRGLAIFHAPAALAAQKYTPAARATQNVTGNQTGYSTTRRRGATRPSASISAMPMNLRSSPSVTRTRPSDGTPAACTG